MASLVCPSCDRRAAADAPLHSCPCGDLFDVQHGPSAAGGLDPGRFAARRGAVELPDASGVWRFRELVYPGFPAAAIVSLFEGNTPLYRSAAVDAYAGLERLDLKHEGMNPTGSFKDRGMTVAVSRAVASGATRLACASTGNTAASLAAYAAAAGVDAVVLAPEGATASGKLAQAVAYGARTVLVRGDFDAALALVRELAAEGHVSLLNSVNPFRIEGQKSIVFELLAQLGWEPPEWLVFPAGNLGNCTAFAKALLEARRAGLIDSIPRLVAVQASGAAPFARSFARGFAPLEPVRAETVASAIRIGHPASFARAVRAIRATAGLVLDVSDADLLDAKAVLDRAGIGAEPASAASLAGVVKLRRSGVLEPRARVAAVLTGHLLKDPETTLAYHGDQILGIQAERANPPVRIEPTRKDLLAAIRP